MDNKYDKTLNIVIVFQFLANEQFSCKSTVAIVEFKSCDGAERCIKENDGTRIGDQVLHLSFAIPGYSGVDFVWNKPVNTSLKKSQVGYSWINLSN